MTRKLASARHALYAELHPGPHRQHGLSRTNKVLTALILGSCTLAIVETEPSLTSVAPTVLRAAELGIGVVFSVEYALRLWTAIEDPRYQGRFGRLKYVMSIWSLIDLLAIAPLLFLPTANEAVLLRLVRLLRILRLARLGHFSRALELISETVKSRRYELAASLLLSSALMLFSATLLYLAEGDVQPEVFGSIPRAIWWSVATLTTVGYGDVYPITACGKLLASITAILGIGFVAMPTGILAAAFGDIISRERQK